LLAGEDEMVAYVAGDEMLIPSSVFFFFSELKILVNILSRLLWCYVVCALPYLGAAPDTLVDMVC